jgi:hypothetical protein
MAAIGFTTTGTCAAKGEMLRRRQAPQMPSPSRELQTPTNPIPTNGDPLHLSAFDYFFAQDSDEMYNGDCTAIRKDFVDGRFITPGEDQICNDRARYFFEDNVCFVGWTVANEFIEYPFSSSTAQEVDITFRVAAKNAGKTFYAFIINSDPFQGQLFEVPSTGDWGNFIDITWNKVPIQQGNDQLLRINFITGSVNLCSVSITPSDSECTGPRLILQSGDTLSENDPPVTTSDGYASITQEDDGNLVVKKESDGTLLCESGYEGELSFEYLTKLQGDGNLLTFDNPSRTLPAVWKSGSVGSSTSGNYYLAVNCDDSVEIYEFFPFTEDPDVVIWTCPTPEPPDTTFYETTHLFSIDDVMGGFDGSTFGDSGAKQDRTIICGAPNSDVPSDECPETMSDKDGTTLYPIDSEFGLNVLDFVGGQRLVRDNNWQEGFAGDIEGGGVKISNVGTSTYKVEPPLGTWCQGLSSTAVKCSTEHYSGMYALL